MIKKPQIEVLLKAIGVGMNVSDSCGLARVSREWFYKAMKENKKFAEDVQVAELECKQRNIAIIQKAAMTQWQASAWFLERRHPHEFALKARLEHTSADGEPLTFTLVNYSGTPPIKHSNGNGNGNGDGNGHSNGVKIT